MSDGLTLDKRSFKVTIDGIEISSENYSISYPNSNDEDDFKLEIFDVKTVAPEAKAGTVVLVTYQSTLNENAVIGAQGNPNTANLEYSRNPNWDGDGTAPGDEDKDKTPDDTVIVFTYKTIINKVDNEGNPLTGAEFKLEKKMANGTWKEIAVVKNDAGTIFTFTGLDDGLYRLTETTTPAGYNTIDPIYFEITAEHEVLSDNPALTSLSATQKKDDSGAALDTGVVATFAATCTPEDGTITSNIVNQSGATLPETGGMGTTLFYIIGSILVLGAVVVMITRKRMSTK